MNNRALVCDMDVASTKDAIALFDSLPTARAEDMIGRWTGAGFPTDHPLDGLLEASYWHGKVFEDADRVHPLVHRVPALGEISVNPALLPIGFVMSLPARDKISPWLFPLLVPFLRTRKPRARLRDAMFRGRCHAAMVYDDKPIIDIFVEMEPDKMLGWMDFRAFEKPFFFTLTKD